MVVRARRHQLPDRQPVVHVVRERLRVGDRLVHEPVEEEVGIDHRADRLRRAAVGNGEEEQPAARKAFLRRELAAELAHHAQRGLDDESPGRVRRDPDRSVRRRAARLEVERELRCGVLHAETPVVRERIELADHALVDHLPELLDCDPVNLRAECGVLHLRRVHGVHGGRSVVAYA